MASARQTGDSKPRAVLQHRGRWSTSALAKLCKTGLRARTRSSRSWKPVFGGGLSQVAPAATRTGTHSSFFVARAFVAFLAFEIQNVHHNRGHLFHLLNIEHSSACLVNLPLGYECAVSSLAATLLQHLQPAGVLALVPTPQTHTLTIDRIGIHFLTTFRSGTESTIFECPFYSPGGGSTQEQRRSAELSGCHSESNQLATQCSGQFFWNFFSLAIFFLPQVVRTFSPGFRVGRWCTDNGMCCSTYTALFRQY